MMSSAFGNLAVTVPDVGDVAILVILNSQIC